MSHLDAQRAVVRMLFDPRFAEAARKDPETVLSALEPALRRQLAAVDERAFRLDGLRRRRALRTLSEEFKASTTLVLQETRSLAFLEQFFGSTAFHRCVEERGSMPLAFAEFLAGAVAEGRLRTAVLAEVLVLETTLAQSRRAVRANVNVNVNANVNANANANARLRLAPGVFSVEVAAGALSALQQAERYLFEVGLMPAVALCDDAPRFVLDARAADPARLQLVTVPSGGAVSLVTVDQELARVLRSFHDHGGGARSLDEIVREAAARGVPESHAREIVRGLVEDEIAVPA